MSRRQLTQARASSTDRDRSNAPITATANLRSQLSKLSAGPSCSELVSCNGSTHDRRSGVGKWGSWMRRKSLTERVQGIGRRHRRTARYTVVVTGSNGLGSTTPPPSDATRRGIVVRFPPPAEILVCRNFCFETVEGAQTIKDDQVLARQRAAPLAARGLHGAAPVASGTFEQGHIGYSSRALWRSEPSSR